MADPSSWIDEYSFYQYADVYSSGVNKFVGERAAMDVPPENMYREHTVVEGESCFSLAGKYYHGLVDRPSRFWRAIMEVNKIIDPTQPLRPGKKVKIPDLQYILLWLGYRHDTVT